MKILNPKVKKIEESKDAFIPHFDQAHANACIDNDIEGILYYKKILQNEKIFYLFVLGC